MAIDKNIAALLDENAYTVQVVYPARVGNDSSSRGKVYTFVSNIHPKLQPGDSVLVGGMDSYPAVRIHPTKPVSAEAAQKRTEEDFIDEVFGVPAISSSSYQTFAAVLVMGVNDDVVIEPDAAHAYRWVVGKVDTAAYDALMARNKKIEQQVADSYKHNMRRSFKNQVLGGLPEGEQAELLKLLGN